MYLFLQTNHVELCPLAADFKAKGIESPSLAIFKKRVDDIKNILEIREIPIPEKCTKKTMAEAIYKYVVENCPEKCIDFA